jgi:uncharacterized OB-fold protein
MSKREGIYRTIAPDREIDHHAWLRARAEGRPVGSCRSCGDYMMPQRPDEHSGRTDYEAQCRTCGRVLLAPGGRRMSSALKSHRANRGADTGDSTA